jgi:hypothetical protein
MIFLLKNSIEIKKLNWIYMEIIKCFISKYSILIFFYYYIKKFISTNKYQLANTYIWMRGAIQNVFWVEKEIFHIVNIFVYKS